MRNACSGSYQTMLVIRLVLLLALMPLCGLAHALSLTIKYEGIGGDELKNVQAYLTIEKEKNTQGLYPGRLRRLHNLAADQIKTALQPFGYYKVKVQGELTQNADRWTARYVIDRGEPLRIAVLNLTLSGSGADTPAFAGVRKALPLQVGKVFNHAHYEEAKYLLQRLAAANGYLDAHFVTHEVIVDLRVYQARIDLHFDTGMQYVLGEIQFVQEPQVFKEAFLRRYIALKQNDVYTTRALLKAQNVLSNSKYFTFVEIRPDREHAQDGRIAVAIHLTPDKKYKYRLGLGYGTDTGPRATFEHTRRINGSGHYAVLDAKLSQKINSGEFRYVMPLANPSVERLVFSAQVSSEQTESRYSVSTEVSAKHTGLRGRWQETVGITYEREDFEIADEKGTSSLLYPSVSWMRVKSDNSLFPRHGWRVVSTSLGTSDAVGSDVSFAQTRLSGKRVDALGKKNRVLLRGDVGATFMSTLLDLPASKRFFAGGDQSVRGYGFEALGPRNEAGDVIGGKYLISASAEYERVLFGKWSAAVFYDAGNALNELHGGLKRGTGVGLRWRSPVGPIRLDVATPLDDPNTRYRLHLVIGPDL